MSIPKQEFELDPSIIYLNHASISPWPKRTKEAVIQFAEENCRVGATHYPRWQQKERELREQFKEVLNAPSSDDIALVKNTSEALSFVAYGLDWKTGDNIVTSSEEFPSNRIPWESLSTKGVELRQAAIHTDNPEQALFQHVDNHTRLITVSSVQYASGRRMNLEQIGEFCRKQSVLFCVDAIQSLGALQSDVQRWQADYVMADGHKWLLGPEGLGVFYSTPDARDRLSLSQYGWHMVENAGDYDNPAWEIAKSARRFECGSPNMLGIHALSASLSLLLEVGLESIEKRVLDNTHYLIEAILAAPDLTLLSPVYPAQRSGIVTFKPVNADTQALFQTLRRQNIICAHRGGGIRFSPHFYTQKEALERAMEAVRQFQALN